MDEYAIEFYRDEKGRNPAGEYYHALQKSHTDKAAAWFRLLRENGPNLCRPYADMLDSPVRELRPQIAGLQHRFLYVIHGKIVLITNGFLKNSDRVPNSEIERAKRRYADWLTQERL